MDRVNVLSGDAFRTSLFSALIFVIVFVVSGSTAYIYIQKKMYGELTEQILHEVMLLNEIYSGKGGLDGVLKAVRDLDRPLALNGRAIGVFKEDGTKLAGNIVAAPTDTGWARGLLKLVPDSAFLSVPHKEYFYYTSKLDGLRIVSGRGLDMIREVDMTIIFALITLGSTVILLILGIGYFSSRQSLRKLERLEQTLGRVSQGATSGRLEVSARNDQIDRISRRVNVDLDRLDHLMTSTRNTIAAIAHDLKTPLSRAYLSLEKASSEIDKQNDPRAMIEATQAELMRLNTIFDTILRIAHIEAQGDHPQLGRCDLWHEISELAETFSVLVEENHQHFVLTRDGDAPYEIECDSGMLAQMLVNLVQNGVNHCPARSTITVSLTRDASGVLLSVADDGPGIPAPDRAHVFDPFYRVDSSRTKPGCGLGLSLVKAIAERHGADITLRDNAPGLRVTIRFSKRTMKQEPFKTQRDLENAQ